MTLEEILQDLVAGREYTRDNLHYAYNNDVGEIECSAVESDDTLRHLDYQTLEWYRVNYRGYYANMVRKDVIFIGGE